MFLSRILNSRFFRALTSATRIFRKRRPVKKQSPVRKHTRKSKTRDRSSGEIPKFNVAETQLNLPAIQDDSGSFFKIP